MIPYKIVQLPAYPGNWYRQYPDGHRMHCDEQEAELWQAWQEAAVERNALRARVKELEAENASRNDHQDTETDSKGG